MWTRTSFPQAGGVAPLLLRRSARSRARVPRARGDGRRRAGAVDAAQGAGHDLPARRHGRPRRGAAARRASVLAKLRPRLAMSARARRRRRGRAPRPRRRLRAPSRASRRSSRSGRRGGSRSSTRWARPIRPARTSTRRTTWRPARPGARARRRVGSTASCGAARPRSDAVSRGGDDRRAAALALRRRAGARGDRPRRLHGAAAGRRRRGGRGRRRASRRSTSRPPQELLRDTGGETFDAIQMLRGVDLAQLPAGRRRRVSARARSGSALRQIALLVKADVGLEVAFAESGGWDTHVQQGAAHGSFSRRADDLARSIAAFWTRPRRLAGRRAADAP